MTQFSHFQYDQHWYSYSFTTGPVPSRSPHITTEADALARAMWLERHGYVDEASDFLDRYCAGYRNNGAAI